MTLKLGGARIRSELGELVDVRTCLGNGGAYRVYVKSTEFLGRPGVQTEGV